MGTGLDWLGLTVVSASRPNCIWVDSDGTFDLAFKVMQMSGQLDSLHHLIKRNPATKLAEGNLLIFLLLQTCFLTSL
jgi:hypothetical protein